MLEEAGTASETEGDVPGQIQPAQSENRDIEAEQNQQDGAPEIQAPPHAPPLDGTGL